MKTLDLTGPWRLRAGARRLSLPATVPGCVHADLLAAGRIEDPFYRDNESGQLWIGRETWTYERDFDAGDLARLSRVELRCDGLDTLATVTLNGVEVGRADNMHRAWRFDIRDALRPGRNRLAIRFDPPLAYIERRQAEHPIHDWHGPREPAGRGWLRKMACNFGWDWGPVLPTCGIWRPIAIEAWETARIDDLQIRQRHAPDGAVTLDIAVAAEYLNVAHDGAFGESALPPVLNPAPVGPARRAGRLPATDLRVEGCASSVESSPPVSSFQFPVSSFSPPLLALVKLSYKGATIATAQTPLDPAGRATLALPVRNPQLWWPNGLGDQPLYEVTVELLDTADRRLLDSRARRIGLRTLRLERQADEWGESFRFSVNGVPFFAKGANWIPADALVTRLSRVEYARLVKAAASANMNMLRVWGGGIYEQECFYDLCDEYGLCVWQDFMFACSTYPSFDEPWLATVAVEAEQQVRRLRHHPCLALWCGNNELEQGLVGDPDPKGRRMSWDDYSRLFDRLLPETVARLDPDRDYWPGSPHTPPPGERANFNDPARGDAHLWSVWHGREPFEWYRTSLHRFCSEFGFQSFPEPRTVAAFTAPADRNVTSPVMEHHQRSGAGNALIVHYMLSWFRLPAGFENTLWLSQIQQGLAMKYAVEHWRRLRPRCMGAIYWQLNDCWPVASWASLDAAGRWKALHYMARRFYAPLLVSGVENEAEGTVEVFLNNDNRQPFRGELSWRVTTADGRALRAGSRKVRLEANGVTRPGVLKMADLIRQAGAENLLVWLTLSDAEGRELSSNLVTFRRPKQMALRDPRLRAEIRPWDDHSYAVTLQARHPALWCWLSLDAGDARFEDNFFNLEPGQPQRIHVTPVARMKLDDFRRSLRIRSLWDTWQESGGVT